MYINYLKKLIKQILSLFIKYLYMVTSFLFVSGCVLSYVCKIYSVNICKRVSEKTFTLYYKSVLHTVYNNYCHINTIWVYTIT